MSDWASPLAEVVGFERLCPSLDFGNLGYAIGRLDHEEDPRPFIAEALASSPLDERIEDVNQFDPVNGRRPHLCTPGMAVNRQVRRLEDWLAGFIREV